MRGRAAGRPREGEAQDGPGGCVYMFMYMLSATLWWRPETSQRTWSPPPQLEPQITSLEKCKINKIILETPDYEMFGVGVGVPIPSAKDRLHIAGGVRGVVGLAAECGGEGGLRARGAATGTLRALLCHALYCMKPFREGAKTSGTKCMLRLRN